MDGQSVACAIASVLGGLRAFHSAFAARTLVEVRKNIGLLGGARAPRQIAPIRTDLDGQSLRPCAERLLALLDALPAKAAVARIAHRKRLRLLEGEREKRRDEIDGDQ